MKIDNTLTALDKISRARISLNRTNPFFAYLAMYLKPREVNEIPTMGVNQRGDLAYNTEFVNSLGEEELKTVIAHETMHLALLHLVRVGSRDKQIWNIATDLVINTMLKANSFTFTDKGYVIGEEYDDCFKFNGDKIISNVKDKNSEEIYDELFKGAKKIKISMKDLIEGLKKKQFEKHDYDTKE